MSPVLIQRSDDGEREACERNDAASRKCMYSSDYETAMMRCAACQDGLTLCRQGHLIGLGYHLEERLDHNKLQVLTHFQPYTSS